MDERIADAQHFPQLIAVFGIKPMNEKYKINDELIFIFGM